MTRELKLIAEGLHHAEALRWRNGRLWFSDVFSKNSVNSIGPEGDLRVEVQVDGRTESIGWLPNGDLLIVAMDRMQVLRRGADGTVGVYADLREIAGGACNGMVIHPSGQAYVCNFGFDVETELTTRGREAVMADHALATMALIHPDGRVEVAADGLDLTGNAPVITPDGKTLIVGEMYGHRLTAFDIADDGSLHNRRVWASLPGVRPDAMCLDAEGAIWMGTTNQNVFLRVAKGGEILERIETDEGSWGVMLGGEDGRTLYLSTTPNVDPEVGFRDMAGKIWSTRVEVPRAGYP